MKYRKLKLFDAETKEVIYTEPFEIVYDNKANFYIYSPENTDIRQFVTANASAERGFIYRLSDESFIQKDILEYLRATKPVLKILEECVGEDVRVTENDVIIGCRSIPKDIIKKFAEAL